MGWWSLRWSERMLLEISLAVCTALEVTERREMLGVLATCVL